MGSAALVDPWRGLLGPQWRCWWDQGGAGLSSGGVGGSTVCECPSGDSGDEWGYQGDRKNPGNFLCLLPVHRVRVDFSSFAITLRKKHAC